MRYFYDGAEVIAEYNENDVLVCRYIMGRSIDEPMRMERLIGANWHTYYYQTNALGSIAALTEWDSGEEEETIVERYTYDAYGRLTVQTPGADGTFGTSDDDYLASSSVGNPYGFTARALDNETGLMYYRARYYSTVQGRFLGRDPEGYVDGMNLYFYAKNNPMRNTDPLGRVTNEAFPPIIYDETYGKYGGPGYGDDQFDEEANRLRDPNSVADAVDSLDQVFKEHDLCYETAALLCTREERNEAYKRCDQQAAAKLKILRSMPMSKWPRPPKGKNARKIWEQQKRARRWMNWAYRAFSKAPGKFMYEPDLPDPIYIVTGSF